jgi:hypothetical protein
MNGSASRSAWFGGGFVLFDLLFRDSRAIIAAPRQKKSYHSLLTRKLPARKNRPGDFSQNTNKFVSNHKFGRLNGRK